MPNTQMLKGIRCPNCLSESTFVVQMTSNVVMQDDGDRSLSCSQPPADYFPDRAIPEDTGFRDDDPIECFARRGGCGRRGTVKDFHATPGFIADSLGRRFVVPWAHLDNEQLAREVNNLVRQARRAGYPTALDREITADHAAGAVRRWALIGVDSVGDVAIEWNLGGEHMYARVCEDTPGAQPVTVYEE